MEADLLRIWTVGGELELEVWDGEEWFSRKDGFLPGAGGGKGLNERERGGGFIRFTRLKQDMAGERLSYY